MVGPRYFYGGAALTQTGGHADMRTPETEDICPCCTGNTLFGVIADGVDECRKATREQLRKGANHIKIMASGGVLSHSDPIDKLQYSSGEISAIVDECDRRGVYACAHCHPAAAVRRCVECGVRCIEHGTLIDTPTAAFVAEKGAFVVPTMATIFALVDMGPQLGLPSASYEKLMQISDSALKGLEIMKQEGVKIGFGTDLLGKLHTRGGTEFTLRRQVLSAADILISATSVNADILQMKDKLGVVKKGAFADLLLVDGNPLENIELLAAGGAHLSHIMLQGKFVKRPKEQSNRSGTH
jgi:imidazolonepropionase-like amidohydrolase